MQRQLLEQLRHQHGQRRARIVSQVADQAAGGHVRSGFVEDVAGALHLHIGLRDLHIRRGPAIAAANLDVVLVRLVLDLRGEFVRRQRHGVEGRRHAEAVSGGRDDRRADLAAAERRGGDGGHGGDQRAQGGRRIVGPRVEIL